MKKSFLLLLVLLSVMMLRAQIILVHPFLNSNFEYWQENKYPVFWLHPGITVTSDSVVRMAGNYSLKAVRGTVEAANSQSPYGLVFQNIASAYENSQLNDKKIEVSVQVKGGPRDTSLHVCAFIQVIDPANPANNNIAVGNDAVGDAWMQSSASLILKKISPVTSTVAVGVIMSGYGEVWIDDYQIRVGDETFKEINPRVKDLTAAEIKWLKKNIIPVSNDETIDKKLFGKNFKDARIVGIGDNVHGSSSIIRLKNLAARALIGHEGFTILAIEDNPAVGASLDRFVRGMETTMRQNDVNIMFSRDDFRNFMIWLKNSNQTAGNKVQVFGVDINSKYKELVEEVDSMTSRRYTVLLDSVYAILDKVLAVYHPMYDAEKALFSEDQKRIISENLNTVKKEALAMEPDQQRQELLAYYIHNLLYYLNYSKIEREKLMADNITWLIGRHPEAKIVYLAHNQHVGNRNNGETKSTGGWLKKRYGDRYDIIATCYYTGTDLFKQHALGSQQAINVSLKGSYERLFNQQEENCFYLDLSKCATVSKLLMNG